jgi:VWFA-related protein
MNFRQRARQAWAVLLSLAMIAPGFAAAQEKPASDVPAAALRVTTRLVLVDVVVRDKAGQPVTDLQASDFTVSEKGKAQKISIFALERPAPAATPPPMPPNVFTNRPGYRMPEGPLTILLLDGMNTQIANQNYARQQLLKYLKTQHQANQRMAVFALGNTLRVLQDFTSDPRLLRAALESYAAAESPALAEGAPRPPSKLASGDARLGGAAADRMRTLLGQFETEQSATNLERRISGTLAALRLIARAMAGYPGRKNLIWVSASFPVVLFPDAALPSLHVTMLGSQNATTNVMRSYEPELKATENLLSEAQVAVYPVDARGLVGAGGVADASNSGLNSAGLLRLGADYGNTVTSQSAQLVDSTAAMKDLADETGGRAYYSRNDIDNAVALGIADGSIYYLIGYYPEDKSADGSFRKISVNVDRPEMQVRHRPGYYAIDDVKVAREKKDNEKDSELMMAMGTEALTTNMVVFDARVTPPAAGGGPVTVEVLVNPRTLSTEPLGGGQQQVSVDFYAAAFAPDGKVVAHKESKIEAPLSPDQYAKMQQGGLPFQAQLELKPGNYSVRIAIRDNRTGYFGTLEAPISLK